ncbi:hypothetical protein FOZ63_005901, partial [Perkinsus olseni]
VARSPDRLHPPSPGSDGSARQEPVQSHVQELFVRAACHLEAETKRIGYQDGTGLTSALPSAFARADCPASAGSVASCFWEEVQAIMSAGVVQGVHGSTPSAVQQSRLGEVFAASSARLAPRLASVLRGSSDSAASGSPVRADLGFALATALGDPDPAVFRDIDAGLSLGVDRPIAATGIFPRGQAVKQNFSSVEAQPAICRGVLEKEVGASRMRRLSLDEAGRNSARLFARMALVPKQDKSYRLIEDHSGSGLNSKCHLSVTCSLPRGVDVRRILSDVSHESQESCSRCSAYFDTPPLPARSPRPSWRFFKYDISGAFRHLLLRPEERCRTSVRLGSEIYENLALPFGASVSPFHWCRTSAAITRMASAILRCVLQHRKFGDMIFVDDGLLLLQQEFYAIGVIVFLLLWIVKFIGLELSLKESSQFVRVHPDIFASIRDILLSFVDE